MSRWTRSVTSAVSSVTATSCLHPHLFEIEVALDQAEHVVVNRAPVTHPHQRLVVLIGVLGAVTVSRHQLVEQLPVPGPDLVELADASRGLIDQLATGVRF